MLCSLSLNRNNMYLTKWNTKRCPKFLTPFPRAPAISPIPLPFLASATQAIFLIRRQSLRYDSTKLHTYKITFLSVPSRVCSNLVFNGYCLPFEPSRRTVHLWEVRSVCAFCSRLSVVISWSSGFAQLSLSLISCLSHRITMFSLPLIRFNCPTPISEEANAVCPLEDLYVFRVTLDSSLKNRALQ